MTSRALLLVSILASAAFAGDPGVVLTTRKVSANGGGFPADAQANKSFGRAVSDLGDVDGDGVVDLIVGAPIEDHPSYGAGAIYVLLMNADGTVKASRRTTGPELGGGGQFGYGVTGLGDFDGDGVPDAAVGARTTSSSSGSVWILFLDTDGSVKSSREINVTSQPQAFSGSSVADIGDLDGDGVTDLAVGAPGHAEPGETYGSGEVWIVLLNADGSIKSTQSINNSGGGLVETLQCNAEFGEAVEGIGDLDGDGVRDLAVGALRNCDGCGTPCTDGQNTGAAWILFLNPNGTVKAEQKIATGGVGGFSGNLDSYDFFGQSLAWMGDVDGDGIGDLAVGSPQDDDGSGASNADRGAIYVLFLNQDGTVKGQQKISQWSGNLGLMLDDGDRLASALACVGDVDGDGQADLIATALGDDDGAVNQGAFYTAFTGGARFKLLGFGLPGNLGEPAIAADGELLGNDPAALHVTGAEPNAAAFLILSPDTIFEAFLGGVVVPDYTLPGTVFPVQTDALGEVHVTATWEAGLPIGYDVFVQVWIQGSGPFGWTATQGLRAIQP